MFLSLRTTSTGVYFFRPECLRHPETPLEYLNVYFEGITVGEIREHTKAVTVSTIVSSRQHTKACERTVSILQPRPTGFRFGNSLLSSLPTPAAHEVS